MSAPEPLPANTKASSHFQTLELPPELQSAAVDLAISKLGHSYTLPPLPLECDGEINPRLESRYLIKGLLGTATKIVIFGPPGCGKSFLAYDMARHGCRGLEWFGRRVKPFTA